MTIITILTIVYGKFPIDVFVAVYEDDLIGNSCNIRNWIQQWTCCKIETHWNQQRIRIQWTQRMHQNLSDDRKLGRWFQFLLQINSLYEQHLQSTPHLHFDIHSRLHEQFDNLAVSVAFAIKYQFLRLCRLATLDPNWKNHPKISRMQSINVNDSTNNPHGYSATHVRYKTVEHSMLTFITLLLLYYYSKIQCLS